MTEKKQPKNEQNAIVDAIVDDVGKKLSILEILANKPLMFVSEYFYSIRNEIDIETETILLNAEFNSVDEGPYHLFDDSDDLKPNAIRDIFIEQLKEYEENFVHRINKIIKEDPNHFVKYRDTFNDMKNALNKHAETNRKEPISNYEKFMQIKIDLFELEEKIDTISDQLKSELLSGHSFIYKKGCMNQVGILVIFESAFLNEPEIRFIK